jgi:predicted TIM-barrel fold metal-dependent hydrolase
MTHVETRTATIEPTRKAVKLVDCDVHATATDAMLAPYMGASARRLQEQFGRATPRITDWYPRAGHAGTDWYPRARNAGMRADSWPDKPGHVPGSDPEMMREQLLDEYDVDYAILEVLTGQDCYDHPELAAERMRATNDWQLEHWLDDDRVRATIAVAHEYPELAIKEIERWADDPRYVAVLMPGSAAEPLGSPKYWPIYAAATEAGRPVVIHTGGYYDHRGAGYPSYYLDYHVANGTGAAAQLTGMALGGMFEAVPGVRVALTENGVAWAAALRWSLDVAWEAMGAGHPSLTRKPSEYIDEHVWFTSQPIEEPADPQQLLWTIDQAKLRDRLLFSTDYPHWDFDSPTQALPRVLGKELREKILATNACDLYGLPHERDIREA